MVFPLIEAGGLNSNIIQLARPNCTSPGSTACGDYTVIRAYCLISRTAVWPRPTGYFALHVINIKPRILVF